MHKMMMAMGMMLLACGEVDESLKLSVEQALDDDVVEIVENLREAGYPDDEIEVGDDGTVVVGGDAVVSLEASREMVEFDADQSEQHEVDSFRQYRTTNQVAAWVRVICVNGSALAANPTLSAALDDAIANYQGQRLRFDMMRTPAPDVSCDAEIVANLVGGSGGSAGFPAGGLPYGTINIGSGIGNLANARHVITHELGHAIGFRHSDYYNRSISCGLGGNEGSAGVGAIHIPGTPANAVYNGSVMNSCYNAGSNGQWTASDLTALSTLYGVSAMSVQMQYANSDEELTITWPAVAGASFYVLSTEEYPCYRVRSTTSYTRELKPQYLDWTIRVKAMTGPISTICNFTNAVTTIAKSNWTSYCSLYPSSTQC